MGSDGLSGSRHASSVRPSGAHRREVHHYVGDGSVPRGDGEDLNGGPQDYEMRE